MKTLRIVVFVVASLFATQGYSAITLQGPSGTSDFSVSLCDIEDFTLSCVSEYLGSYYTWTWYLNGSVVWVDPYHSSWGSTLPAAYNDGGTWVVQLALTVGKTVYYYTSNDIVVTTYGISGSYDVSNIDYRIVSGDFDGNNRINDVAAFYYYGNNSSNIHVWKSNGSYFSYEGDNGWWSSSTYDATKTNGKVVSGDFDNDGMINDIAAFYEYPNTQTKIHLWQSNNSSFSYSGTWWISGTGVNGYDASKITGRVVRGDFDNDGYIDDIAVLYDCSNSQVKAHVFLSNGTNSFSYGGVWLDSGVGNFDASKVVYRVVSGDFDNDNYQDDIAVFYEFPNYQTKIFVFRSNGSSFITPLPTWFDSGLGSFDASKIIGKVSSGDFDNDNYVDDICVAYDMGSSRTCIFTFKSNGTGFITPVPTWYDSGNGSFDANRITGTFVSGDFDKDNKLDDLTSLYDYDGWSAAYFTWKSNGSGLSAIEKWWEVCESSKMMLPPSESDESVVNDLQINLFPNPCTTELSILLPEVLVVNVSLYNLFGVEVSCSNASSDIIKLDMSGMPSGVYYLRVSNEIFEYSARIVKN